MLASAEHMLKKKIVMLFSSTLPALDSVRERNSIVFPI